ncbi:SWIM zinc finger family protein [Haladaptatus pallidirubidus]|uniref:SWIM-type domain-containing protein n=1 Tax=Haladaptatus pallidirubidus TaxID=1008152 RepID=A0AAV3UP37_9EURY|nr:SWIM zinc finger family protein [Haladaptatus pallidirubidus]
MVEVTNQSHEKPVEHQYTVSIDDGTDDLMTCTCPHHVHRAAYCKHMAAVENATDDGTLDAFPSDDDETDKRETAECDCDGLVWLRVLAVRAGRPQETAELTTASARNFNSVSDY